MSSTPTLDAPASDETGTRTDCEVQEERTPALFSEQSRLLYRVVPSAIFTVNQDRIITSWNLKAAEITGYAECEVIGKSCLVFAESPCNERCGLFSANVPKPISARECSIRRKDGERRFIRKNADLMRDSAGNIIGGIESFEDITEPRTFREALAESEALYRGLFDDAIDIVYTHDMDGNFTSLNRAGELIMGYSASVDTQLNIAHIVVPEQMDLVSNVLHRLGEDPSPIRYEIEILTRSGRPVTLEVNCRAIVRDGIPLGVQGIARDVTEARAVTKRMAQAVSDLQAIHETALSLNSAHDLGAMIHRTLTGLYRLTEASRSTLLIVDRERGTFSLMAELRPDGTVTTFSVDGEPCDVTHGVLEERKARFVEDLTSSGASRASIMEESVMAYVAVPLLTKERLVGIVYLTYEHPRSFSTDTRQQIQVVASHAAVAIANLQMFDEARQASITDSLTRLPNHRHLMDRLDQEIARATRAGHPLSVMMIDIDDFKLVNDAHGHITGDELLRRVSQILRSTVRATDIVGRYGGDEFLILLPETDQAAAMEVGGRLLAAIRDIPFLTPGKGGEEGACGTAIPVRLSVGVSTYPYDSATRLELISLADTAMYSSKQSGGNRATSAHTTDSGFLAAQNATFSVLEGLVNAVDAKDHYTRIHSEEVARHALTLASALGLSSEERRMLRVAGLLHDVGKIGIPDRILRKPGGLSTDEREIISQHALLGEMIIREVPHLTDIIEMVRHHHERYDGGGYPRGLRGEEIPYMSRLIAVADCYSAMTLDRPYRRALSREEAIAELKRCAGTQLDPGIVATFVRLLESDDQPVGCEAILAGPGQAGCFPAPARP